jgi:hypothetical protein
MRACLPYGKRVENLVSKATCQAGLEDAIELASMSKWRMSRTSPQLEIGILVSLLVASLELLRLGASDGVGCTA